MTRFLRASPEVVFAAWTSRESVLHWMFPDGVELAHVEMDVRVGGVLRVDMIHGGERTIHTGVYREIVPPELLVFTWISRNTSYRETLVRVELVPHGDGTQLTLTHSLLPDAPQVADHVRGWSQIAARLALYVHPLPPEPGGSCPS